MNRAQERDLRYHNWLDQIIEALREERRRDAADVIGRVPVEEAGDFILYCCINIERGLHWLKQEAQDHATDILSRDRPSPN